MKVLITGGLGFLGLRLARRLTELGRLTGPSGKPEAIDHLALFDMALPRRRPEGLDERAELIAGDIADRDTLFSLVDRDDIGIFHLASVVSGGAEKDFDLAMNVNLMGGLSLFEACRGLKSCPRLVFASSIAVFGGAAMPPVVGDTTKQTPQTTYGTTKAALELFLNDYTRKGFLDGRSARLPTVIIRPGKPNAAASSFASGVFREPLRGEPCVVPVARDTPMPVMGYREIVEGLIRLYETDGTLLGDDRAVSLPSLTVTVGDMIESLQRVAGERPLGEITIEPDPFIEAICRTWPRDARFDRALTLGLPRAASLDQIVRAYIEDYVDPVGAKGAA
ncbi:MAG: D-erythronate dehydrogenase [Kiloniellales bacterium]